MFWGGGADYLVFPKWWGRLPGLPIVGADYLVFPKCCADTCPAGETDRANQTPCSVGVVERQFISLCGFTENIRIGLGSTRREASASYIERTGTRTGSTARRSARPPRSYRVRYRRLESWTSLQERRRLCQGPDTAEGRRGQTVGVGILSVSGRKHGARKAEPL